MISIWFAGTPSAAAITSSVDVRSIDFDYYRVGQIQERYVADDEEEEQNSAAKNDDLWAGKKCFTDFKAGVA